MLEADIIRPSNSNWCSPAFLIKKKAELPHLLAEKKGETAIAREEKPIDTSQSRIIVDLRGVNRRTIISKFPLPDLVTLMAGLGNAKLICQFDFTSAYYQLPVSEEHRHKTAFAACSGLYEFNVVPLGCAGGPASFCLLAQKVLRGMIPEKAVIYLDDALVYGNSFEQVMENLREFFTRIANAKLKLKWRKCSFFQSEISYLGYQISSRGVRPDPANIEKVKNFPTVANAKEARRFVALCAYYKRLIKDFSQLTEPLNALQRKNIPFSWTDHHQECFEKLRDAL
uniref:Reverse transcriptase domain-containing protein n=1 Tax=Plectus sambesii TaxID=2011161 RepID=A0A914UJA7_9BILA